jgi:DnaJ-class molecular chaperone
MDLYAVLGVHRTATEDEIKSVFRRLALQNHPDKSGKEDSLEEFKKIIEA